VKSIIGGFIQILIETFTELFTEIVTALRTQVGASAATLGLAISGYVLLHYTLRERWAIVALLNNFAHWITLAAPLCLLLVMLSPRHRMVWGLFIVPGVVAFLYWSAPLLVRRPAEFIDNAPNTLRVATYNIARSGVNAQESARTVNEMNADIVVLQEFAYPPMLNFTDYPYEYTDWGLAVLSRYPIEMESIRVFVSRDHGYALRVLVDFNGQKIAVYSVHLKRPELTLRPLAYTADERFITAAVLREEIADEFYPVLAMGDFNTSDRTDDYLRLRGVLSDVWRDVGSGWGLTAPYNRTDSPLLLLRSDYIMVSPHFEPIAARVWHESTSDHLPVLAQVRLRDQGN
jgi:endonuclease/exonuclease/phosphatase family metal-dependent hydrolase